MREALDINAEAFGPNHPDLASNLNNLSSVCIAEGKYLEAEILLRRAIDIDEKALGFPHPDSIDLLKNYSSLLRTTHQDSEADKLDQRIKIISQKY